MKKSDRSKLIKSEMTLAYAVCPGGEGAVLKIVGLKRLARSNRVHGVEERVKSFRASLKTFAPPFASRTILLRAERDRPLVF